MEEKDIKKMFRMFSKRSQKKILLEKTKSLSKEKRDKIFLKFNEYHRFGDISFLIIVGLIIICAFFLRGIIVGGIIVVASTILYEMNHSKKKDLIEELKDKVVNEKIIIEKD